MLIATQFFGNTTADNKIKGKLMFNLINGERVETIQIDLPEASWFRRNRIPVFIHNRIYAVDWSADVTLPSGRTECVSVRSNTPAPAAALRALRTKLEAYL